jgi:LysM repeat protein
LFILANQRITRYIHQHRLVSIISAHAVVIMILTIALLSSSLGTRINSVFASTSCHAGDQTYRVMDGETLSSIATSHGTTWQALAQQNSLSNPDRIYTGQTICLPTTHASHGTYMTLASAAESPTSIINEIFGADAPAALRIAMCESTLNPNAVNSTPVGGSHAQGLFQILYPSTWNTTSQAGMSPFNARANAIAAHEIFVRDGHSWREWACRA